MKFFKYTILAIGFLSLIASIFNIAYTQSFSNHTEGIYAGIILIGVSIYLKTIINLIKNWRGILESNEQ
jgi:hypothetical protein